MTEIREEVSELWGAVVFGGGTIGIAALANLIIGMVSSDPSDTLPWDVFGVPALVFLIGMALAVVSRAIGRRRHLGGIKPRPHP